MHFKDLIIEYLDKKKFVIVNGIEAERVKDKKTGEMKGGTFITDLYPDFIVLQIHNVKADSKTDNLTETIESVNIPLAQVVSLSEGPKDNKQGVLV